MQRMPGPPVGGEKKKIEIRVRVSGRPRRIRYAYDSRPIKMHINPRDPGAREAESESQDQIETEIRKRARPFRISTVRSDLAVTC